MLRKADCLQRLSIISKSFNCILILCTNNYMIAPYVKTSLLLKKCDIQPRIATKGEPLTAKAHGGYHV